MMLSWKIVGFLGLTILLCLTGLLLINTSFMLYDDEGYVLLTFQKFITGERLYTDIFSQYGPFPYLYSWSASGLLQTPLSHSLGRNLTLFHWVGSSLFAGALAFRLTRDYLAGLIAASVAFVLLWQLISEPSHPGSVICLILSAAVYAACCFWQSQRWTALGATIGIAAAILAFTKINIGILFIAGAGAGALLLTNWPARFHHPAAWLACLGLVAIPWGLMASNLANPGVLAFAIHFTISITAILWVTAPCPRVIPKRCWATGLMAFTGVALVICALIWIRGTSPSALLQGVLLDPLRHPAHFLLPVQWPASVWPLTTISTLFVAIAGWELRHNGSLGLITLKVVVGLRFITAAFFIFSIPDWATNHGIRVFMAHSLLITPLFLLPLRISGHEDGFPAKPLRWITLLIIPQVLHAYPVAGSQMSWGTFLIVPLIVAGLHDAWKTSAFIPAVVSRWIPRVMLAAGLALVALLFQTGWQRHTTSKPLSLLGAEHIRINDSARLLLRTFTLNASIHADVLFSRPGMFSYNIWSEIPTPTSKNATHWFWLLDAASQGEIIERLRASPHSAIITSGILEDFLVQLGISMESPLQTFIQGHYKPLFTINRFDFLIPIESNAVPFGLNDVFTSSSDANALPVLIQTNVALRGTPADVQLVEMNHPWSTVTSYIKGGSTVTIEPITAKGAPLGQPLGLHAAGNLNGLYRVKIFTTQIPKDLGKLTLVILGQDNAVLSESMFY